MTTLGALISLFPTAGLAILFCALPYWQRDRLFFGVTVAPEFRNEPIALQMVRTYRWGVVMATVAAIVTGGVGLSLNTVWLFVAGILLQPLGAAVLFARAHAKARPFALAPATVRVASLSAAPIGFPGGWLAVAMPFVILAAAGIYLQLHLQQLPPQIPVHWGIDGKVNGWSRRGGLGPFGFLLGGALISIFLAGMGWVARVGTRRGGPDEKSSAWQTRFQRAMLLFSVRMMWILSVMMAFLTVAPLWFGVQKEVAPAAIATGALLILTGLTVWPLVRLQSEPGSGGDGTPDECWKWGELYYNPNDPALLVGKRFGIGYTFNWANRAAWFVCTCLLGVILAGIVFLT